MKNCSGRDCPIRDNCQRYVRRPSQSEKWNMEDFKYDHKGGGCKKFIETEYQDFPDFMDHEL